MNRLCSVLIVVLLSGCASSPKGWIRVTELETGVVQVIGALGKPLGTVAAIEAVVVEVPEKLYSFGFGFGQQYGLRVEKVDGKSLAGPVVLRFKVDRAGPLVKLAAHETEMNGLIFQLTRGEYIVVGDGGYGSGEPMSREEAERIRDGYVGSRHSLLVFETGSFFGVPHGLPHDDYGFVYSFPHEYHFSSRLVVFAPVPD